MVDSSPCDPLAAAAILKLLVVKELTTCPVAFFSTTPSISATFGRFLSIPPSIFSSIYEKS